MQFNCKMGYSGNEQDYQLIKTSLSELKKAKNQTEVLRYLTNVLPNPTDIVTLDNAQNTVKSVKAQLANKNLIPYPYLNSTKTIAGITFTVSSDGTITANGTATSNAYLEITSISTFYIPKGNYILSGCPSGGSSTTYSLVAVNGAGISYTKFRQDIGNGITLSSSGEYWIITCRIMAGQTVENLVFKPQIELGITATAYTPYISDFSTVKVIGSGKNLFDKDNANVINGYFTASGDVLNTNATSTRSIWIPCSPNTTYTVSKMRSSRFAVGFTNEEPTNGITVNNVSFQPTATKITAASGNSDKYIIVWFYHSSHDTSVTVEEILATLQIELGTTATEYEPYQGQTYTPTTTGEVKGITVLNPTTNIMNDKGLLFTKVVGDDFNYIN